MDSRRLLSRCAVAGLVLFAGADARQTRVLAALEEFDRRSSREMWPGFEPAGIPLEIFDGRRTWLVRYPAPPSEFTVSSERADTRFVEGRHASMRSNTSIELAGVPTATASFEGRSEDAPRLAALLFHEAFHVFQARRHPKWGGNEVDLFLYPVGGHAGDGVAEELIQSVVVLLFEPQLPSVVDAVEHERGSELKEGLARYIETQAAGKAPEALPSLTHRV